MVNTPEQSTKQTEQPTGLTSVREVCNLVRFNKAILIEGEDFVVKKQLAADVVRALQSKGERYLTVELRAFFTTPFLNEELRTYSFQDPEIGRVFNKLPSAEELEEIGDSIIVLDGISGQGPRFPEHWMRYIGLPNTKFILLSHITGGDDRNIERERENAAEWLKLFEGEETATGHMEYSPLNRRWSFVSTSPVKVG